jgi:hypothetical protein
LLLLEGKPRDLVSRSTGLGSWQAVLVRMVPAMVVAGAPRLDHPIKKDKSPRYEVSASIFIIKVSCKNHSLRNWLRWSGFAQVT